MSKHKQARKSCLVLNICKQLYFSCLFLIQPPKTFVWFCFLYSLIPGNINENFTCMNTFLDVYIHKTTLTENYYMYTRDSELLQKTKTPERGQFRYKVFRGQELWVDQETGALFSPPGKMHSKPAQGRWLKTCFHRSSLRLMLSTLLVMVLWAGATCGALTSFYDKTVCLSAR